MILSNRALSLGFCVCVGGCFSIATHCQESAFLLKMRKLKKCTFWKQRFWEAFGPGAKLPGTGGAVLFLSKMVCLFSEQVFHCHRGLGPTSSETNKSSVNSWGKGNCCSPHPLSKRPSGNWREDVEPEASHFLSKWVGGSEGVTSQDILLLDWVSLYLCLWDGSSSGLSHVAICRADHVSSKQLFALAGETDTELGWWGLCICVLLSWAGLASILSAKLNGLQAALLSPLHHFSSPQTPLPHPLPVAWALRSISVRNHLGLASHRQRLPLLGISANS